ncbi:MAG TPA: DNA-formamidopyrimidine glycosylase family protein [Candidatus Limnocylindrales bacterium]
MPELPDLTILAEAFGAALVGRTIDSATAVDPLVLRATPAELAATVGDRLLKVRRRGKFLILETDRTTIWAAPMLTGRFGMVPPGAARPKGSVVLRFGPRAGPGPADTAAWARGADWLPAPDTGVDLRYLDPTRMGKLYLVPADAPRDVPGTAPADLGPDADDPALTLDRFRERIRRHPGELKGLLRNQAFVAGIGNAYSDEILWAARLNPFRRRSSLADEEVDALYAAIRETLGWSISVLRARVAPTFEKQVRDHLKVHLRGGKPCLRCGSTISQVGGREATSYCRACQR